MDLCFGCFGKGESQLYWFYRRLEATLVCRCHDLKEIPMVDVKAK